MNGDTMRGESSETRQFDFRPSYGATAKHLREMMQGERHSEAVADCRHCTLNYAADVLEALAAAPPLPLNPLHDAPPPSEESEQCRKLCEDIAKTFNARFLTYTNAEAAVIASRNWERLLDTIGYEAEKAIAAPPPSESEYSRKRRIRAAAKQYLESATPTDNKTPASEPVLSDVKTAASVSDAELELLTYLRSSRTITISDPLAAYLFCGETGLTQEQTIRVVERLRKWRVKHDD